MVDNSLGVVFIQVYKGPYSRPASILLQKSRVPSGGNRWSLEGHFDLLAGVKTKVTGKEELFGQ